MVGFSLAGAAAPAWLPWGVPAGSLPHPARPPLPPSNHHALSAGTSQPQHSWWTEGPDSPLPMRKEGCFVSSQA